MPKLPALCDRCGEACLSRVNISDETIFVEDHREGACPCGGTYIILDGTYVHLGGSINLINTSRENIDRFKEALRRLCM